MKNRPVILAVSGIKNSGKTTLITRLIPCLKAQGLNVAVIKHDGHDFKADTEGTDSFRHKEAGAYATAVFSASRFLIVKEQQGVTEQDLIPLFPEADLILLEGFKGSEYPKIEVVRSAVSREPVCRRETVFAYATDYTRQAGHAWMQGEIPCFGMDEAERLTEYIMEVLL